MSSQKIVPSMPPNPIRLRQIALVAADLDRARHLLTSVIGTEVIFEDPAVKQWGLKNILVALDGDIIEVVSPFRSDTTASRQLAKRGDGGYMIIMQTLDANARKQYIERNRLAKVIFSHELEDSVCIQYHPKGIRGGVIPELDSHNISSSHPLPLLERYSPWHAAGPPSSYSKYSAAMRKHSDLHLLSAVLRLAPGDHDTNGAAQQWEHLFGVQRGNIQNELGFMNAKMVFLPGEKGKHEGIVTITIGVNGKERLANILQRAADQGLQSNDEGSVKMLGILWKFVPMSEEEKTNKSRL